MMVTVAMTTLIFSSYLWPILILSAFNQDLNLRRQVAQVSTVLLLFNKSFPQSVDRLTFDKISTYIVYCSIKTSEITPVNIVSDCHVCKILLGLLHLVEHQQNTSQVSQERACAALCLLMYLWARGTFDWPDIVLLIVTINIQHSPWLLCSGLIAPFCKIQPF